MKFKIIKNLIKGFIKTAVPEFASDLDINVTKHRIAIYAKVALEKYSSTSSIMYLSRTLDKNRLRYVWDGPLDTHKKGVGSIIDFELYNDRKRLREFLLPELNSNLKRCQTDSNVGTWAMPGLTHDQSILSRLAEVKSVVADIFTDKGLEQDDIEIEGNVVSFPTCFNFRAAIYLHALETVSVELEDLKFPPDQDRMSGGYTITPFLYGDDLKFDSSFKSELCKLMTDPSKYLSIERGCAFGDKNSELHNDDYYNDECYHE